MVLNSINGEPLITPVVDTPAVETPAEAESPSDDAAAVDASPTPLLLQLKPLMLSASPQLQHLFLL